MNKAYPTPAVYLFVCSLIYAAGLRWWLKMSCAEFARLCELVLSGVVVVCKIGVKCHFVPFDRMFSIEKDLSFV